MKPLRIFWLCFFVCPVVCLAQIPVPTYHWRDSTSSAWEDPLNWTPANGQFPGQGLPASVHINLSRNATHSPVILSKNLILKELHVVHNSLNLSGDTIYVTYSADLTDGEWLNGALLATHPASVLIVDTRQVQKALYRFSPKGWAGLPATNFESGMPTSTKAVVLPTPLYPTQLLFLETLSNASQGIDSLTLGIEVDSVKGVFSTNQIGIYQQNVRIGNIQPRHFYIQKDTSVGCLLTFYDSQHQSDTLRLATNLLKGQIVPLTEPFRITGLANLEASLHILDVQTNAVAATILKSKLTDDQIEWNHTQASTGVYRFTLTVKGATYNGKFIKKKID